jgi:hypothetical protein
VQYGAGEGGKALKPEDGETKQLWQSFSDCHAGILKLVFAF